jgi:hypothetical protein
MLIRRRRASLVGREMAGARLYGKSPRIDVAQAATRSSAPAPAPQASSPKATGKATGDRKRLRYTGNAAVSRKGGK